MAAIWSGRVKDGQGDYYRQVRAPKRTIDRDSQRARWMETGDDQFFHAEVYCQLAEAYLFKGRIEIYYSVEIELSNEPG
jgi:hypothetical protein